MARTRKIIQKSKTKEKGKKSSIKINGPEKHEIDEFRLYRLPGT